MFQAPLVRPRADQRPFESVFVEIGCVCSPDGTSVTVAPAIGFPVALSTTTPCRRARPRNCAVAAVAIARERMRIVVMLISLRMDRLRRDFASLRTRVEAHVFH